MPAGAASIVVDDRPRHLIGEHALDLPDDLAALLDVRLLRLLVEELLDVRRAVARVVRLRLAGVGALQHGVRIVDADTRRVHADGVVLLDQPAVPDRRLDQLHRGVEIDAVELIDEDHGRVLVGREVPGRDLDRQPVARPVAEAFHDPLGFGLLRRHVTVARQLGQHLGRQAPLSLGARHHVGRDRGLALTDDVDERLPVERQYHRAPHLGLVERRLRRVDEDVDGHIVGNELADGLRCLGGHVLHQCHRHVADEGHVEVAGDECQDTCRAVRHDLPLDAVEIGLALVPVARIACERDRLIALELDELEGAGADRLHAHVARRDVAGKDWRQSRRQHGEHRWLAFGQMERDGRLVVDRHLFQVLVPDRARATAVEVLLDAVEPMPGALHVLGRERLAVVPADPGPELEGELGSGRVPGPACGQIGDDGVEAVLRLVVVVADEVVEEGHERHVRGDGRFLVDRGARRLRGIVDLEHAAGFLRLGGSARKHGQGGQRRRQSCRDRPFPPHRAPPASMLLQAG